MKGRPTVPMLLEHKKNIGDYVSKGVMTYQEKHQTWLNAPVDCRPTNEQAGKAFLKAAYDHIRKAEANNVDGPLKQLVIFAALNGLGLRQHTRTELATMLEIKETTVKNYELMFRETFEKRLKEILGQECKK
ncbi:MAG: hypothetical protein V1811_01195 [Candidatus Micrarchaeota archaeon]